MKAVVNHAPRDPRIEEADAAAAPGRREVKMRVRAVRPLLAEVVPLADAVPARTWRQPC